MSANFYKNEMDREMLLNIEIQKQNLKALPERFKAQKKVVSPVTQQMIDDYKQQFRDSYKRTDDKGTSTFYKFLIPEAEPTLEIIDKDELLKSGILEKTLNPDEIKKTNDELTELIDDYNYTETVIQQKYKDIESYNKEINELSAERVELLNINLSLDKELDLIENKIDKYKEIYEKDTTKKNYIIELFGKFEYDKNEKMSEEFKNNYYIINQIDKELKKKIVQVNLANNNITTLTNDNINRQTEINALKKQLEINDEIKLKNEKVLYTIEQNNKKKLADYAKTIQIMNNGEISLEQQQGESEQDYLKRLADVALIEEDPTRAFLYNTNQFKKNLKTLIKSEWKIENLIKSFSNDDQFLLNKTFAGFKKYFNNLYGPGNKDLDVEEYVNIIREYIDSPATSLLKKAGTKGESAELERLKKKYVEPYVYEDDEESKSDDNEIIDQGFLPGDEVSATAPAPATAPASAPATAVATIVEDLPVVEGLALPPPPPEPMTPFEGIQTAPLNNVFYDLIQDDKTMIIQEKSPVMKAIYLRHDEADVYYSYDNADYNSFASIMFGKNLPLDTRIEQAFFKNGVLSLNNYTAFFTMLRPYTKARPKKGEERKRILKPSIEMFVALLKRMGVKDRGQLTGAGLKKSKTRTKSQTKPKKPKKQLVVQKGANIKEVPYRCEFGKSVILLNKLYYNNILSVKDSKGINIQGIPNSKVDDKFVNIIMKICNNEDINNNDVLELTDKDAILFSVLMNKSGLKKKYNIDNTKSIKALKDRLALVEGQMLAGNTNDEIKTELYDIVFKLAQLGATSLSVARKYFKDTEKLMF